MFSLIAIVYPDPESTDEHAERRTVAQFTTREKAEAYVESSRNNPHEIAEYEATHGVSTWRQPSWRCGSLLARADDYSIEDSGEIVIDPEPLIPPDPSRTLHYFEAAPLPQMKGDDRNGYVMAVMLNGERFRSVGMFVDRFIAAARINGLYLTTPPGKPTGKLKFGVGKG